MITYYHDLLQGSEEWLELRRGKLTASTMKRLLTPVKNKKAKGAARTAFMCELLAQRVTGYVDASYMNDDMLRGTMDEETVLAIYSEKVATVQRCGFIEIDDWGFPFGYSPDGLVGDDGLVEIKSHKPGLQVAQILTRAAPLEHRLQLQTGLLVSGRKWIDCISYSGGLPMQVIRVEPDYNLHEVIEEAAREFEYEMKELMEEFQFATRGMIKTERKEYGELI